MALQTTIFHVSGMCCIDEEMLIRRKLDSLKGVEKFKFNLVSQKLTVEHTCPKQEVIKALHQAGFHARSDASMGAPKSFWEMHSGLVFTSVSGLLTIIGLILSQLGAAEGVTIPLFLGAILSGGWRIAWRGLLAAKNLTLDMNFLMTIAAIGAMAIGEWVEAAAVVFLFSLALLLESYSIERTRRAVRSLMASSPALATVKRGSVEQSVLVEHVLIGDVLVIRPGEYIPLDGMVLTGHSFVNQAPITGESSPSEKKPGDTVYAGTLNERGALEIRVTALAPDSMLARITQMVEEAHAQRAPSQTFVERFAAYYTPAVIGVGALIAIVPPVLFAEPFEDWFYRALVLLVIACPCALVISTPVTIVSGLTNAARRGILIKGGRYLEEIGQIGAVAFDKTGTLTEGVPRVTDVIPLNSLSPAEIITLTAAIEAKSEHHLASAVLRKAYEENARLDNITYEHFESITGRGIEAIIDGVRYVVGNHDLIEERGICSPKVEEILQRLEGEAKTAIILGTETEVLGVIAIADDLRQETANLVRDLHRVGVQEVIMLTGDNAGTARAIARKTGIDEFHASVLPHQKVERIKDLRKLHGRVAMVGDGVNDAPALAASTIGIAMGTAGTDAALDSADIVLMSDDLPKISYLMSLSKKTLSIIKQNIALALLTKLVFLVLGLFGVATLWMAILADDGAALIVIINGLRVLRFRSENG